MRIITSHLAVGTLWAGVAACGAVEAQQDAWRTDFSKHTVPLEEIVSGGPPKDGIPAIDDPRFVSTDDADRWLEAREPVVVIDLGSEVRAYPLQILIWHEIVNDVVGGTPVTVTYCPLCNTALAFDRRFDGDVLDFGTTGRLRHSDLVMYDRQTETWWQQATGEAIVGHYAGERLRFVPAPLVSWREFAAAHPDGRVLSRDTGYRRAYGRNPYVTYDEPTGGPLRRFFGARVDDRLPAMARVVALQGRGRPAAFAFSHLAEVRVVNDEFDDAPIAVLWAPETASAVDAGHLAEGRDVGASNVVRRTVGDRTLTFVAHEDGRFRDRQTGSIWNLLGHAVEGPLAGTRLSPVPHGNHFWFAWAVFQPNTRLVK
jgi:hypothetical protein